MITNEDKLMVIRTSLNHMLNDKKHFSISTIHECAQLAGIIIKKEYEEFLYPLHCINFSQMDKALLEKVIEVIDAIFKEAPVEVSWIGNLQIVNYKPKEIAVAEK